MLGGDEELARRLGKQENYVAVRISQKDDVFTKTTLK